MSKQVPDTFRIGIVCGKLGDVDGVSLEVEKWIKMLSELGHEIITFSGRYAAELPLVPAEKQILIPEIRFGSPEQQEYERLVFPYLQDNPPHLSDEKRVEIIEQLEQQGTYVANKLFDYIKRFSIDVIIAENTNAMPMTLIGGMAIYKLATWRRVATIFHHHDFWWERSRFSHNYVEQLLGKIMPPVDPGLEHVVISSYAEHILRSIKRVHPKVIPNCEDFEHAVKLDEYNSRFRGELGFSDDDLLIVQPTRIVRRKRIEDSLALVGRFLTKYPEYKQRVRFVISLYQGDEPDVHYIDEIRTIAAQNGIPLHLVSDRVAAERGKNEQGQIIFTNRDVLANADMVTYLPIWEGFGNALLEAIAAKVPVVTTAYLVYKTDIKVIGFDNIEVRDIYDKYGRLVIDEVVLKKMQQVLSDQDYRSKMVERNFKLGQREFGMKRLKDLLGDVIDEYGDEIRACRKRIEKSKRRYPV
jgi:mannosylglucosylglycerate synthase